MEKKRIISCFGCGAPLQNTDPGVTGYTPKIIDESGLVLCQRCYRLQHYGDNKDESVVQPNYGEIFKEAIKKKCLIVYVVDLFAFEPSMIRDLFPFIRENPILVVANKRDILPKAVDDDKLRQFVYKRFEEEGIVIKDVIVSSAARNYNIDEIINAFKALKNGKDIYIVGASSVGKSSLINVLLKNIQNTTRSLITTSPYPGTTVATITIPLDNKSKIYDTPGLVLPDSAYYIYERNVLKYIIPKNEIKPRTYQLNSHQSILIGGIARLDFEDGKKTSFTVYASNSVELLRTKLERANQTMNKLISTERIKPCSSRVPNADDLTRRELFLPNKKIDLVISGLCWISINGGGQKISLRLPNGLTCFIRDPKI